MGLLKGILRHGFLLLVLIGVGFAYYYRTELFPNLFKERQAGAGVEDKREQAGTGPADQAAADTGGPAAGTTSSPVQERPVIDQEFGAPPPVAVAQAPPVAEPEAQAAAPQLVPEVDGMVEQPEPVPTETGADDMTVAAADSGADQSAAEQTPEDRVAAVTTEPAPEAPVRPTAEPVVEADEATEGGVEATEPVAAEQTDTGTVASGTAGEPEAVAGTVSLPPGAENMSEPAAETAGGATMDQTPPLQPFAPAEPESYPEEAARALIEDQAEAIWGPGERSTDGYRYRPDEPTKKQEPEPAAPEPMELLSSARQAFWARDYEAAERDYRALLALDGGNPDYHGELGNLFFSSGQWDKAAEAYGSAVELLLADGRYDRAANLIRIVQGLDPDRARELQAQLDAARNQGGEPQGSPESTPDDDTTERQT